MKNRTRVVVAIVAVAVVGTVAAIYAVMNRPLLDLSRQPQTVFATIPFDVGDSYTLGSTEVPDEVLRPVTVTGVTVIHARNVEVLGSGAFDAAARAMVIGLVPGWRPQDVELLGSADGPVAWNGQVAIVVGLRTTEPKSGLRGVLVQWVDGRGQGGQRVFDLAVLTCAPGACEVDASAPGPMLRELGLQR